MGKCHVPPGKADGTTAAHGSGVFIIDPLSKLKEFGIKVTSDKHVRPYEEVCLRYAAHRCDLLTSMIFNCGGILAFLSKLEPYTSWTKLA